MTRRKAKNGFDKNLTKKDARQILKAEGGEITKQEFAIQVIWILGIAGSLAWAIIQGNATVWHLGLPMVAEYLVCLVLIPILSLLYPHPELRKESMKSAWLIAILIVVGSITIAYEARAEGTDLMTQFQFWIAVATDFIIGKQVHWAILIAAFHSARSLWRNVKFLIANGPPFLGPGMGCGMRIAVLILSVILVPAFGMLILSILSGFGFHWKPSSDSLPFVWLIWGLYVTAELLTLWFLWDIQSKLKSEGVDTSKL